jgi:Protein of unknown function (DUF2849)
MPLVISANRLVDGIVVYVSRESTWAGRFDEATVFASQAEAEAALRLATEDAKRNLVVDPCVVEVSEGPSGLRAVTLRESIRARGPTVGFLPPVRAFASEAAPGSKTLAQENLTGPVLQNRRLDAGSQHERIGVADSRKAVAEAVAQPLA